MAPISVRRRWLFWAKCTIGLVVVVALCFMLRGVFRDLQTTQLDLSKLKWSWLAAACFLYGLGMIPGAIFWHHVLVSLGQKPDWRRSVRAFFLSQLGKYVPGKGMVIVMRTMSIAGPEVRTPVAVTSVFIETLTWMAVGATIGSILVVILNPGNLWLAAISLVVAVCAVLPMSPPVLGLVLRKISRVSASPIGEAPVQRLPVETIARGWFLMTIGWLLVGASLWAVLRAVPGTTPNASHFALSLECVTLSIVLGFVSLLPGGLGVRELVIVPLLRPEFGTTKALACAILIRLIWLISELSIVGIIQWLGRRRSR